MRFLYVRDCGSVFNFCITFSNFNKFASEFLIFLFPVRKLRLKTHIVVVRKIECISQCIFLHHLLWSKISCTKKETKRKFQSNFLINRDRVWRECFVCFLFRRKTFGSMRKNCLFYMSLFQKFGATNCGGKTPIDKNPPRRRERDLKIRKNEKRIR